ncbi:hypothetical protein FOPG_16063 [Fusarium oxysporum f. sp. conglutinans race 2 54008]|uniref:Uncharacterized protein n=1 Tax=Fusarium oxysporum f. sp. conglutinans race 2 54008 TaxID=1089457 RepID=X0H7J9_FUSOX|nr:hypothetical protein FOPG_16063 [Fusarium oxysporum f. sp. conglutinans race 2 54008]
MSAGDITPPQGSCGQSTQVKSVTDFMDAIS